MWGGTIPGRSSLGAGRRRRGGRRRDGGCTLGGTREGRGGVSYRTREESTKEDQDEGGCVIVLQDNLFAAV